MLEELAKKFDKVILLGPIPPQPYAVQSEPSLQLYGYKGTTTESFYKYSSP